MYFYYIMSYSNGLLPSTTTSTNKPQRGLPGVGFKLTDNGNFDIDGKRLTNVADPVNGDDATNKNYVNTENNKQDIVIADKASKSDLNSKLSIDGSISMASNLNMNSNKVINVSGGTDTGDSVNYGQLLEHTENHQNNYHLQPSFTFYKNFGNEGKLPRSTQIKLFPNHTHHGLNWAPKEGSDSGFGAQAWVSLKMTNNLPVGIYTVVFELFSGISDGSGGVTQLNNETLLQQVHGDANYKIITFSHDYQTTHSKAVIQFNSNGQAGEITFQIRYYGSSYNNSTLNFLFFARVLAGRQGPAFNHTLFDEDDVQFQNQILYFEDVNLNENKIKGLAVPSEDKDGVNKKYVDDEIAKLPHSDTGTLKLDGSRAMTGTLDLGEQRVVNIKPFVEDDSSQAASDAQKYDLVNWEKIHQIRADLHRELNQVEYEALNRTNPNPMQANINMNDHFITGFKDPNPSDSYYAASVNFVNKNIDDKIKESKEKSISTVVQDNIFEKVMTDNLFKDKDDGIKLISAINYHLLHRVNTQTYLFKIDKDKPESPHRNLYNGI